MKGSLAQVLGALRGGWAALLQDGDTWELLAHGEDLEGVIKKAREEGHAEPLLMKIPQDWACLVG